MPTHSITLPIVAVLLLSSTPLFADETAEPAEAAGSGFTHWVDTVYLQGGLGTHWSSSEDYEGTPWLGGIEVSREDRHRFGIALFNNSYDQFSQYYYYGYKWKLPFLGEGAHVKLTGGMIYGYVDEFEDKLSPNWNGWAPAIIPSIGWKKDRFGLDVAVLGDAGVMFLIGYDIWER